MNNWLRFGQKDMLKKLDVSIASIKHSSDLYINHIPNPILTGRTCLAT